MQKINLSSLVTQFKKCSEKYVAFFLLAGILAACSADTSMDAPAQKWQDMEIRVESRPSPPSTGMNEFLVIATAERGRPVYDLLVSLRTDDHDEWKQAIQDGQVGVYRRAAEVAPGTKSVLQLQIKRNGAEGILRFPLNLAR